MSVLPFLIAGCAFTQTTAHDVAEVMDRYFQAQFASLKGTEKGIFGTGRIEWGGIGWHTREGGYAVEEWMTGVEIYGNHGKRLDVTADLRYRMNLHGKGGGPEPTIADARKDFAAQLRGAIDDVRRGKPGREWTAGDWTFLARGIRLSKPECVACHKGSKKNDPVALAVYQVAKSRSVKPGRA